MSERLQICNAKKDALFLTYIISNGAFLNLFGLLFLCVVSVERVINVYGNIVYC